MPLFLASLSLAAVAQMPAGSVPDAPPATAKPYDFRDASSGVRFQVPAGWNFSRKDGELSSFRLDALSASPRSRLRAVATINFNPYPLSTLSGELFYFSVETGANPTECEQQATGTTVAGPPQDDIENIGGMDFTRGHEEHGHICTEGRDEIYTAYHRGSCYRFDLETTTFCSVSTGALDLTENQMTNVERRMTRILSSVVFDWEKSGAHNVPVPASAPQSAARAKP